MMAFFGDETENKQQLVETNSTIQTQSVAHKTVPTGIAGFDEALGEGLLEGNIYLLFSDSGEHTKQIIHQILYTRFIAKSNVTYYSFEDSSADIIDEMAHLKMHIQKYVDDGKWKFARIVTSDIKQIVEALPENPLDDKINLDGDIGELTNHFLEEMRNGSDTVMQFTHLIREFTPLQIKQLMLYLKGSSRKFGGIHFIVLNKGGEDTDKEFILKDLADTVFDLTTGIKGNDVEISVSINKARKLKVTTRKITLVEKNGKLSGSTIQRI